MGVAVFTLGSTANPSQSVAMCHSLPVVVLGCTAEGPKRTAPDCDMEPLILFVSVSGATHSVCFIVWSRGTQKNSALTVTWSHSEAEWTALDCDMEPLIHSVCFIVWSHSFCLLQCLEQRPKRTAH